MIRSITVKISGNSDTGGNDEFQSSSQQTDLLSKDWPKNETKARKTDESELSLTAKTLCRLSHIEELLQQFINIVHSSSILSIESFSSLNLKELKPDEPRINSPLVKLQSDIFTLLRKTKKDLQEDVLDVKVNNRSVKRKSRDDTSDTYMWKRRCGTVGEESDSSDSSCDADDESEDNPESYVSSYWTKENTGATGRIQVTRKEERDQLESERELKRKRMAFQEEELYVLPKMCTFCGKLGEYLYTEQRHVFCCEESKWESLKVSYKEKIAFFGGSENCNIFTDSQQCLATLSSSRTSNSSFAENRRWRTITERPMKSMYKTHDWCSFINSNNLSTYQYSTGKREVTKSASTAKEQNGSPFIFGICCGIVGNSHESYMDVEKGEKKREG